MSESEADVGMEHIIEPWEYGKTDNHSEWARKVCSVGLKHLYQLYQIRDKQLYKTISRNEFEIRCGDELMDFDEHYNRFRDMQT